MTAKGQPINPDPSVETDYIIHYSLNEFQRGSMVTRFGSPPGKREVYEILEKYGISSTQISDYSVTPAPSVKQARLYADEGISMPAILQVQDAQSVKPSSEVPAPRAQRSKKNGGCGWIVVSIAVISFAFPAFTSERAHSNGEMATPTFAHEMDFGERLDICTDRLNSLAETTTNIWGEDPGFFDDRVSQSFLHPANFSFLAGCMSD
ncbi:hypothetical protein [Corynebacterium crudilactis]|uniref:Uncharacterized protein n=1 Tax=Corynebacterium crudilactis TaxID=1652495 RepID=A0A172QTN4_9CORY|nr:hypothetical protein [Corynebacterium crudilactis]ANE04069.1 hypothetical protein ccrud_07530 [Corynebacterium crudilactis]